MTDPTDTGSKKSLEEILATEVSAPFIDGMKNRMVVSYYKYGPVRNSIGVDNISSLMTRLRKYADDGNTEWLIDVANFAMMEFMNPRHPKRHFRATDSDESPGRTSRRTGESVQADNREIIGRPKRSKLAEFRED